MRQFLSLATLGCVLVSVALAQEAAKEPARGGPPALAERVRAYREANAKSGHTQIEPVGSEDQDMRVYGDTAVITGRITLKGKYSGKEASGQYRSINVWVNQEGRWRLVANQLTLIAKH